MFNFACLKNSQPEFQAGKLTWYMYVWNTGPKKKRQSWHKVYWHTKILYVCHTSQQDIQDCQKICHYTQSSQGCTPGIFHLSASHPSTPSPHFFVPSLFLWDSAISTLWLLAGSLLEVEKDLGGGSSPVLSCSRSSNILLIRVSSPAQGEWLPPSHDIALENKSPTHHCCHLPLSISISCSLSPTSSPTSDSLAWQQIWICSLLDPCLWWSRSL